MARLHIEDSAGSRQLPLGERIVVGRDPAVDLPLADDAASRRHCEFVLSGDGYLLRDLGSSNGTFVNGSRVEEARLGDGDKVRIGSTRITFHARDADWCLRFVGGEYKGDEVPLSGERVVLGRRAGSTRVFRDIKVSGLHLEVVREGERYVLRDLGSTNGTLLDGRKVDEVALGHGDRFRFGDQECEFVDLRESTEEPADAPAGGAAGLPAARGGRVKSAAALAGLLVVLGGAGFYYFRQSSGEGGGRAGPAPAPPPTGCLLLEDWSFEDPAAAASLWSSSGLHSLAPRRGGGASGAFALSGSLDGPGIAVAARRAVEVAAGSGLDVTGSWRAEGAVLCTMALRFLPADDSAGVPPWTTVVAQTRDTAGAYREFSSRALVPDTGGSVEMVVVARGQGEVALDDLALLPAAAPPPATRIGELDWYDRGGSFVLDHRAPLLEFFQAWGRGPGEEDGSVEYPAGAFECRQERDGTTVKALLGPGEFAPAALAAFVYPDVAAAGLRVLTDAGCQEAAGVFSAEAVNAVLLGTAAERVELALDPPCALATVPRGEGLELRLAPPGQELSIAVRAEFQAENDRARELLLAAQNAAREHELGAALSALKEIRGRLPYNEQILGQARELEGQLLRQVTQERDELLAEIAAARFLDSLERYEKVLDRAEDLAAKLEGSDLGQDLAERAEEVRVRVTDLATAELREEAQRVERLAEFFAGQPDRARTAEALRLAVEQSYADSEAAAREGGS